MTWTDAEADRPCIWLHVSERELAALLLHQVPDSVREQARQLTHQYCDERLRANAAKPRYQKHTRTGGRTAMTTSDAIGDPLRAAAERLCAALEPLLDNAGGYDPSVMRAAVRSFPEPLQHDALQAEERARMAWKALRKVLAALGEPPADASTAAGRLISDVLHEYRDELDQAACERCKDCGATLMCAFHSLLSFLQRQTMTTAELDRRQCPPALGEPPAPSQERLAAALAILESLQRHGFFVHDGQGRCLSRTEFITAVGRALRDAAVSVGDATPPPTWSGKYPPADFKVNLDQFVICERCQMRVPSRLATFGIGVRGGDAAWCAACRTPEGPDGQAKRAEVITMRKTWHGFSEGADATPPQEK